MEQTPKPVEAPKPKSRTMLYAIIIIVLIVVGVGVYYLTRPPPAPSGPQVSIQDDGTCTSNDAACLFNPASIAATGNGTAVTWTNKGTAPHTVHACVASNLSTDATTQTVACPKGLNSNSDAFASSTLSGTSSPYSHAFSHAGTYYYYCSIHTWMHANVTVS